jgi:hypothetical protein
MATQWTAGLTDNTTLPAATLNTIGAAWETWTPTVTSQSGTITTGSLQYARYARIQKLVVVQFAYNVTTAGTGSGGLRFTLPITAKTLPVTEPGLGVGREYLSTGNSLICQQTSTTLFQISNYNGGGVVFDNRGISITAIYEAA